MLLLKAKKGLPDRKNQIFEHNQDKHQMTSVLQHQTTQTRS